MVHSPSVVPISSGSPPFFGARNTSPSLDQNTLSPLSTMRDPAECGGVSARGAPNAFATRQMRPSEAK